MYSGGFVSSNESHLKNLDSVVTQFFKKAYEIESKEDKKSIAFWQVGVLIELPTDNVSVSGEILFEIIKGYLLFQKNNSLYLFHKSLEDISMKERKSLAEQFPLYISMSYLKKDK